MDDRQTVALIAAILKTTARYQQPNNRLVVRAAADLLDMAGQELVIRRANKGKYKSPS